MWPEKTIHSKMPTAGPDPHGKEPDPYTCRPDLRGKVKDPRSATRTSGVTPLVLLLLKLEHDIINIGIAYV
jgi:hypothetical protein